jgi:hypothetical protein
VIVTVWPPIVTVPVRVVAPPLAVAVIAAVPLPVVAPVTVRNDELAVAVHWQFEGAVTAMLVVPPPLFAFAVVADNTTAHPVGATNIGAACVKTTVEPFTVMLAERASPVLAAKLYATDPLPVPVDPDVIVR